MSTTKTVIAMISYPSRLKRCWEQVQQMLGGESQELDLLGTFFKRHERLLALKSGISPKVWLRTFFWGAVKKGFTKSGDRCIIRLPASRDLENGAFA
ncbi:hypothetical protein IH992_01410 [Candidatus Poribacteria bacterium]|nr:hypothetical protein [Candidatus Poribacteria bacterium]